MAPARLSLDDLAPEPKIVTHRQVDYEIRGDLSVPMMILLLRLEERLGDTDDTAGMAAAFEEAYDAVMGLIRERTPDAANLDLSVAEVMQIMSFAAGDESVTDAVAAALLTDQAETARQAGEPTDGQQAGAGAAGDPTPPDPTAAASPSGSASPSRSSVSDFGSDGNPATGDSLTGASSAPTSEQLVA